jgi:hypothetical protein
MKEATMQTQRAGASASDIATEVNTPLTGLAILILQIFPLALPGLMLFIAPLLLVAIVGALLAAPFILAVWLTRLVLRSRSRRHAAATPGGRAARGVAVARS